eukprot:197186_1
MSFLITIIIITTVCTVIWVTYGKYQASKTLQMAKKKFPDSNVRRMGLLSELWQIMYETHNSPMIHAFEIATFKNGTETVESVIKFWTSFSKKYINFRSVPVKINSKWFWIEKLNFDPTQQIKQIEIDSKHNLTTFLNDFNLNSSFNEALPYWEAYYITFKQQKNEAVGYLKLHHALGDGILLNKIITEEHFKLWQKTRTHRSNSQAKPS